MTTAERVAADAPDPDLILTSEEVEDLADPAPSEAALAKIEDEERRRNRGRAARRARMH
jgi:hypothetical protein